MTSASPWIVETTDATFERDVVERSHVLPVVVDFWATWCGPCRMLGPLLEKLAVEANGKFLLVKAELDRVPGAAGSFRVEAIPAVFGLRGGRVVDQFLGLLGEAELRAWLENLQPSPAEQLLAEALQMPGSDPAAETKLREALKLAPQDAQIKLALARVLLEQNRPEESERLVSELAARGFLEPEAERLQAELAVRRRAAETGPLDACRAAAAAAPADLGVQWKLAGALAGARLYEESLQTCLRLVQLDRRGVGESARQLMVDVFRLLEPGSELVTTYRRKLSSALY